MAINRPEQWKHGNRNPAGSLEYYRYLEQDERLLAEIAVSEETRKAHLILAGHYHELALRAARI